MEDSDGKIKGPYGLEDILQALREEISRAKTQRVTPQVALLLADIDNLERFNRWYGRSVGDRILRSLEGVLNGSLEQGDLLTRYGGDEFLILLRNATQEGAEDRARAIIEAVNSLEFGPHKIKVSVSIGVAHYFSFAFSPEEFLGCVVEALISAQKRGGIFKVFMEEEWDEK